jgi:DNA-binding NtrC family response regulator
MANIALGATSASRHRDNNAYNVGNNNKVKFIMAVDDDFDIINMIRIGLQRQSFTVFGFTDPLLALEHFGINATKYSLVISDLRMPGMNGFEFVRKVKEVRPDIKVFLMTAFEVNDLEFSNVISSVKIDEFITKPFTIERLNSTVLKHVSILKKT